MSQYWSSISTFIKNKHVCLIIIFLILSCCVSFSKIVHNDFINFDDKSYILANNVIQSGIHVESITWVFTNTIVYNWIPLSLISHILDWSLFGTNASGHHIVSLLFHIGTVIFLFLFLLKTTHNIWPSAFAAAFFALHPLRVESVAWAAERKDVLSLFFGMASLYVYSFYANSLKLSQYVLCLILFALSLMSKSMLVTLPFVFLLLDYWPLGRWPNNMGMPLKQRLNIIRKFLYEKIPFILLTTISSIITFVVQYKSSPIDMSFSERVHNANIAYVSYLKNIFWPSDLALFYYFTDSFPMWQIISSVLILCCITIWIIYSFKKRPFLLVGWLWYLGTLFPVIGLIPTNALIADHYTYLPSIGIAIIVAWSIPSLIRNEHIKKNILIPSAGIIIVLLVLLTCRQCGYWKNSIELWTYTLKVTKNNSIALVNLASALFDAGNIKKAEEYYNEAIRIKPKVAIFYTNRGAFYEKIGRHNQAINDFNEAIRIRPDVAGFYKIRGDHYHKTGQYNRAIDDYNDAIRISPKIPELYYNRAITHGKSDQLIFSIEDFNKAISLNTDFVDAYYNRGIAYARLGQFQQAIKNFNKTIKLNPNYISAYSSRGFAYLLQNNKNVCFDAKKVCEQGDCKLLNFAKTKGLCN